MAMVYGAKKMRVSITPLWPTLQSEGDTPIFTYGFGYWWDFTVMPEKQTHDTSQ